MATRRSAASSPLPVGGETGGSWATRSLRHRGRLGVRCRFGRRFRLGLRFGGLDERDRLGGGRHQRPSQLVKRPLGSFDLPARVRLGALADLRRLGLGSLAGARRFGLGLADDLGGPLLRLRDHLADGVRHLGRKLVCAYVAHRLQE